VAASSKVSHIDFNKINLIKTQSIKEVQAVLKKNKVDPITLNGIRYELYLIDREQVPVSKFKDILKAANIALGYQDL